MTKKQIFERLNGRYFPTRHYNAKIDIAQYGNGRIAIRLFCEDGPLATLTVNIPEVTLKPGEILVKTWSENERIAADAMKTGWFKDTGKRIPTGFCEAQVWEVLSSNAEEERRTA